MEVGDKLVCKLSREHWEHSVREYSVEKGKTYTVSDVREGYDSGNNYKKVTVSGVNFAYGITKNFGRFNNIEDYFYSEAELRKVKLYKISGRTL